MPAKKRAKTRDRDEDRAQRAAPIASGKMELDAARKARATEFDAGEFDPQAVATKVPEILGKKLVVFGASVRKSDYENEDTGEEQEYCTLNFYLEGDPRKTERYMNTGGVRIVPAVTAALKAKHPFPWLVTVVQSGNVYRFLRKGEKVA